MEICRLKGVDMGEDLEKFTERYPTYIEALEMLEQKDQRIAELEKDLEFTTKTANELIEIKHKLEQELNSKNMLCENYNCGLNKKIQQLKKELAELKENAIVPRFKYKDYVYAIYSDKDIFKGQIDIFDYYTKEYLVFFSEDIGNDWFSANSLFATEQEAQDKLKETH